MSYAHINRLKVIDLCRAEIKRIEAERASRRKEFLDRRRNKRFVFFGRRITDDEIIGGLKLVGLCSLYAIDHYQIERLRSSKNLLALAEASDSETIQVSATDYDHIT